MRSSKPSRSDAMRRSTVLSHTLGVIMCIAVYELIHAQTVPPEDFASDTVQGHGRGRPERLR
jgi:hypothetical protein